MGIIADERRRLLDPVDRVSEILFGLIMAVMIVGSLSIATAGSYHQRQGRRRCRDLIREEVGMSFGEISRRISIDVVVTGFAVTPP